MKKRLYLLLSLAVVLVSLLAPAVKVYVHSRLGEQTAALFPPSISLGHILLKGSDSLPVSDIPPLRHIRFEGGLLLGGLALMALGAICGQSRRRGALQLCLLLSTLALGLMATFTIHLSNLSNSLLFSLLLDLNAWAYLPLVAGLAQLIISLVLLKNEAPLPLNDQVWRKLSGLLALLSVAAMLLPGQLVRLPDSITASAPDAAAMNRSLSLLDEMIGREANLATIAREEGVFEQVISGDLAVLEPYSSDINNVRGVFAITSSMAGPNLALLAAALLGLAAALLAFIPRVDRWFPLGLSLMSLLALGAALPGILLAGSDDMFSTATRQLGYLGLGRITPAPLLCALLALGACLSGIMGLRYANEPYFNNPLPAEKRLYTAALTLTCLSLIMILLPAASFEFYRPGRSRVQSSLSYSGLQALTFHSPQDMLSPKDGKGEALYAPEAASGELSAPAVQDSMRALSLSYSLSTWAGVLLTLGGLLVLMRRGNRRLCITLLLCAFVARALTWLLLVTGMPRAIGQVSGTLWLYLSLPMLVFSAFFSNFASHVALPKKYKLFLMILPFLVAVFLFSYLPLYGWSYAFFNYKFGLPMSEQEFVGFKWFTEMFSNLGHRENLLRVLKNTFGMSGLNLLTSWMPMVFAIFLNEISKTRFKKTVQIFTTLPNFISWALVFSFGMVLFSLDSGIFNKFMLAIGAIDQPVAWLNSPDHIWLKMWAWNTWKGLGWGAIMYLAAIAGLDQELYEAARVDGADRWKQMRYITLPGLLPTFFVLLLLSISNILNNGLEQYMVFQNSMNRNTIEVLDLYVFNITIASKGTALYSFATAIGIFKTLFSVTLLFGANFLSKKLRGESIV